MPVKLGGSLDLVAAKLRRIGGLDDRQCDAIRSLPHRLVDADPPRTLLREGQNSDECCLLLSGHACSTKLNQRGRRQIVSFHVAGDFLDAQHLLLERPDHSLQMVTPGAIAFVTKGALHELLAEHPTVGVALWRCTLVQSSIVREWMVNVGRRDARTRIAHLLCEFVTLSSAAGLGKPEDCAVPLTQEVIADATGLTPIHVNRMLKELRQLGMTNGKGRDLKVSDLGRLQQFAGFNPAYLYLGGKP